MICFAELRSFPDTRLSKLSQTAMVLFQIIRLNRIPVWPIIVAERMGWLVMPTYLVTYLFGRCPPTHAAYAARRRQSGRRQHFALRSKAFPTSGFPTRTPSIGGAEVLRTGFSLGEISDELAASFSPTRPDFAKKNEEFALR